MGSNPTNPVNPGQSAGSSPVTVSRTLIIGDSTPLAEPLFNPETVASAPHIDQTSQYYDPQLLSAAQNPDQCSAAFQSEGMLYEIFTSNLDYLQSEKLTSFRNRESIGGNAGVSRLAVNVKIDPLSGKILYCTNEGGQRSPNATFRMTPSGIIDEVYLDPELSSFSEGFKSLAIEHNARLIVKLEAEFVEILKIVPPQMRNMFETMLSTNRQLAARGPEVLSTQALFSGTTTHVAQSSESRRFFRVSNPPEDDLSTLSKGMKGPKRGPFYCAQDVADVARWNPVAAVSAGETSEAIPVTAKSGEFALASGVTSGLITAGVAVLIMENYETTTGEPMPWYGETLAFLGTGAAASVAEALATGAPVGLTLGAMPTGIPASIIGFTGTAAYGSMVGLEGEENLLFSLGAGSVIIPAAMLADIGAGVTAGGLMTAAIEGGAVIPIAQASAVGGAVVFTVVGGLLVGGAIGTGIDNGTAYVLESAGICEAHEDCTISGLIADGLYHATEMREDAYASNEPDHVKSFPEMVAESPTGKF